MNDRDDLTSGTGQHPIEMTANGHPVGLRRAVSLLGLVVATCGAALRACEAAYLYMRSTVAVPPDSLLHYNVLLAWWRHGDSLLGFTLTPSPYFIDLVIQVPIALLAPDFERFSYVLALVFALLIAGSLWAVVRIAVASTALALVVAGASVAVFYTVAPYALVLHAFMYNHTSEIFSTLGMVALLHAVFRPGVSRRRWAPAAYALLVAACVASSPFFIATYCLPVGAAVAAIAGTEYVSRRRLVALGALTGLGAVAGLIALAVVSRYLWPIRGDHYALGAYKSAKLLKHILWVDPVLWRIAWAIAIAAIASLGLAVAGRIRRWPAQVVFLLVFFPAAVVTCVVLPIKRGAFVGAYELRYLQLPWLLTIAFYAAAIAYAAREGVARVARAWRRRTAPRWMAWCAAVLPLAVGVGLVATMRGPLTMRDAGSTTAAMLDCIRRVEDEGALQDGLATPVVARYLNAARHASDWRSPHVVVQLRQETTLRIDPRENNVAWFNGAYRGGRAPLNFLATHLLGDEALADTRRRIGAPDRIVACPVPADYRWDGKPTFDLWVWTRREAQQRLADMVTHDSMRSPFAPLVGATRLTVDLAWGIDDAASTATLVGGRRAWQRGARTTDEVMLRVHPFALPCGHYRLDVELTAVPAGVAAVVGEIMVQQERAVGPVARAPIAARQTHVALAFDADNVGGPTSGDRHWIDVHPRDAASLEISAMSITLLRQCGIAPFRIFR